MMRKPVIFLIILLLSLVSASAGEYQVYGINDGLSSRKVYQVEQDSTGFIWIYSQGGLDRYDGAEFRHYVLDGQVFSRDNTAATRLCRDENGNICVALRGGQAYRYNVRTDRFECMMDLEYLGVRLHDIMLAGNAVLAGTSSGLYRYEDGKAELIGLGGLIVKEIEYSSDGGLWVSAGYGLYHAEKDGSGLKYVTSFPKTDVISIKDTEYGVFTGTFSDGVYVYRPSTDEIVHIDGLPSVPVRAIVQLEDGNILLGTDGAGVFMVDSSDLSLHVYLNSDGNLDEGLPGNTVSDICIDERGALWIATTTNGFCRIEPDNNVVTWTKSVYGENDSLDDDHVNVIYRDHDGDFWYGTNKGVNLVRNGNKWSHFLDDEEGNVVLAIVQDSKGYVWTGGFGMGLYRINKDTGETLRIEDSPLRYIYHIYSEGEKIWIGGLEGDFCVYDITDGSWERYVSDCIGDIWPSLDPEVLYLAGCQGFGSFDKISGKFTWRREFDGFTLNFPVRALFCASDNTVWMATDGDGLVHFDPVSGTSERFTVEDGLLSDSIISVHEDMEGRIWFTTEEGLFWLDKHRMTIINANDLIDIKGGIFNPNAAWLHSDGSLLFGTSEGVISFDPAGLDYFNEVDIKLILNDLSLSYEEVEPASDGYVLTESLDRTSFIDLEHRSNSFSISFSRLNFNNDFRVRYEYCLSHRGTDDLWITTPASGTADYVNVDPGRYTFILRATDKYSGEILDQRELALRIRQPLYLSPVAIIIYFIITAILLFFIMRSRRTRAYERNMREKMHTFVSVAHDLKTPVSLIKGPLEDLKKISSLPEDSLEPIEIASRNADKLMDMISQLLELRKIEDGSRLQLSKVDMNKYLPRIVGTWETAAKYQDIELNIDVSSDMPSVYIDTEKFERIVESLLSNAIKYTEKGAIDVVVRSEVRNWTLEVQDTGIGIPENEQEYIFSDSFRASNVGERDGGGIGLMIIRQIVNSHEGHISFSSREGEGTTFKVSFPFSFRHADILPEEKVETIIDNLHRDETMETRSTILLVDDENDMLSYLSGILSGKYDILTASNAGIALELARQNNPDLIITDVVMPVMSGEELCRILKSNVETVHIPIILLSAASARQSIIFGLEAGANDYMTKPFDPSVLKARVNNLLVERQHLRERLISLDRSGNNPEPDWPSRMDKEFMDKVISVLEREMANPEFKIGDLCLEIAMSRTALYNKLKSLTGQGPNDFIRIFRLTRAKELLNEKKHSIAEISDMVGFSDPKYFSVCFKKQFGESPSRV